MRSIFYRTYCEEEKVEEVGPFSAKECFEKPGRDSLIYAHNHTHTHTLSLSFSSLTNQKLNINELILND
jgi:hypothetical protein